MTGEIWRTTPPSRADTSAARSRFSVQIAGTSASSGIEPFSFHPDKTLPGTLHHSGNRPAPPSDHTPLARRSAFHRGESGPAREFERGRGVEINLSERISALPCARGRYFFVTWNHGTLRFHPRYCRGDAGDSHEPQRRGIYPDRSETPGFWRWQFRIDDLVRSGRTEARLALLAMRRVQLRIDRELKHATRQLTSCLGFARFSPRPSPLLTGAQAALDQVLYSCIC